MQGLGVARKEGLRPAESQTVAQINIRPGEPLAVDSVLAQGQKHSGAAGQPHIWYSGEWPDLSRNALVEVESYTKIFRLYRWLMEEKRL
jgi:hypothetical protein